MVSIGISKPERGEKYKTTTEESMEGIKRFYDLHNEIDRLFSTEAHKKDYKDLDIRNNNGERFVYRNYLFDFYYQLTEEQKDLIAKFQVIFGSALVEDKHDKEYNLKNYEELNKNFSMKDGVKIGNKKY